MLNELKVWILKKIFELKEVGLKVIEEKHENGIMMIIEKEGIPIIFIGGYPYGSEEKFSFKEHTHIKEVREGVTHSKLKELSIITTDTLQTRLIINEEVAEDWAGLLEESGHEKENSSLLLLKILLLKLRRIQGGNENEA